MRYMRYEEKRNLVLNPNSDPNPTIHSGYRVSLLTPTTSVVHSSSVSHSCCNSYSNLFLRDVSTFIQPAFFLRFILNYLFFDIFSEFYSDYSSTSTIL